MKKKILFLVTVLCCALLTGCFNEKPIDTLSKTVDNLKNAKSLEITALVHAKAEEDGVTATVDIPFTVAASEANEEANMKISLGENAFVGKMDLYAKVTEEKLNMYFLSDVIYNLLGFEDYESEWLSYEMTLDDLSDEEMTEEDKATLEKLENLDYTKVIGEDNFTLVSEEENISRYNLVINKALIERLATELGEEIEDDDEINFELKLDVYIDTTTHQFTKISADLKDIMSKIETDEEVDLSTVSELSFEMEFKNINNTTVTIGEDITKNATNLEDFIGEE